MVMKYTKYAFYALVLYLWPNCYYRYFIRHGLYPDEDPWTAFCMGFSTFCIIMAAWSHSLAGPPANPGILEWHHFRTDEDVANNKADKEYWQKARAIKEKNIYKQMPG